MRRAGVPGGVPRAPLIPFLQFSHFTLMSTKRKSSSAADRPTKKAKTEEKAKEEVLPRVQTQGKLEVLERGHVLFFYRARVELEHAHSAADVARLYLCLVPETQPHHARLLIVPKKRLPSTP